MPSTSPPLGPDTPSGPLSDESALERVFRAQFDALTAAAQPHVRDAAGAAPRVVEALFQLAWNERANFSTAADLDAFLAQQLPHVAARELARRASAHHFGASDAHPAGHSEPLLDVNQAWDRLHRMLHPDRSKAAGAVHDASRHDAASHVKQLSKRRNWTIPIVIALIAIALAIGVSRYLTHLGREGKVATALKAGEPKATQTGDAQIANVTLNDGSTVKVAPDSKLIVADKFGDDMRAIQLTGGAAINIRPGRPAPLEVRVFNATVRAPAGTLLIRTYDDDSSVVVASYGATDSVQVGATAHALSDGAGLFVEHTGTVRSATPGELAEVTTWPNDTLSVSDRPMKQVLEQIGSWYGTKILILDQPLLDRRVTFRAPLGSSVAAIAAVEKAAKLKFGYEGQAMVFRDRSR